MKATTQQFDTLAAMLDRVIDAQGYTRDCLKTPGHLWQAWTLAMQQVGSRQLPDESIRGLVYLERPAGYGTHRDWLFPGLSDQHIETMLKKYAPHCYTE